MPKWMLVYAAAGCAILCSRRLAFDNVTLAGLAVIAWAGLSLAWSSDPASGALQLHKMAILGVLFCAARAWGHDWPLPTLAVISVAVILAWLPVVPSSGFGNENFVADYLLMLTPFLAAFMWQHKTHIWSWLPLAAVIVYLVGFNGARAEYLVAGVALVAGLLLIRCWWTAGIVTLAGFNFLLIWPQVFGASLLARLEIFSATLAMWEASPFWGQGFGAFGYEYPRYSGAWRAFYPDAPSIITPNLFAGAAHNEPLQLMAELGLMGLALVSIFLFLALRQAVRLTPSKLSPALWCVGILGVLSLIGFPLQTPATAALAAVVLGVACGPIKQPIRLPRAVLVPLVACVAATAYLGSLEWRGHVAYGQAAMALRINPLAAFRANLRAYEIYPWDWQIRHQLYRTFAVLTMKHTVKVGEGAMNRIYAISASASPFAPYVKAEEKP